jgi:hypothetical protein
VCAGSANENDPISCRGMRASLLLLAVLAGVLCGCERERTDKTAVVGVRSPAAAPSDTESPNSNAAHYGPHGVAETPTAAPSAPQESPPATGEAAPAPGDMAGHACHCGASCKCGHCAGAVPGCHCKTARNDQ